MARIEQRICDRCFRKDEGLEDHGWSTLEVGDVDFDVCRSCSLSLASWIAAGVPQVDVNDAASQSTAPQPMLVHPARRHPVVEVTRVDGPPRG